MDSIGRISEGAPRSETRRSETRHNIDFACPVTLRYKDVSLVSPEQNDVGENTAGNKRDKGFRLFRAIYKRFLSDTYNACKGLYEQTWENENYDKGPRKKFRLEQIDESFKEVRNILGENELKIGGKRCEEYHVLIKEAQVARNGTAGLRAWMRRWKITRFKNEKVSRFKNEKVYKDKVDELRKMTRQDMHKRLHTAIGAIFASYTEIRINKREDTSSIEPFNRAVKILYGREIVDNEIHSSFNTSSYVRQILGKQEDKHFMETPSLSTMDKEIRELASIATELEKIEKNYGLRPPEREHST